MQSSLLAVFLLIGLQQVLAAPAKPGCEDAALDECGADLFLFSREARVAENEEELQETCPKELNSVSCVHKYSQDCLEGLPRGMVGLLLEGAKGVINGKCNNTSPSHAEYVKYAKCMNKAGDKLHGCINNLKLILEGSASAEAKYRIGLSCCSFAQYRDCSLEAALEVCDKEHSDYVKKIILGYAGDLLDTVCINYKPGSPQCNSLPPLQLARTAKSLSLLPPLKEIISTLG